MVCLFAYMLCECMMCQRVLPARGRRLHSEEVALCGGVPGTCTTAEAWPPCHCCESPEFFCEHVMTGDTGNEAGATAQMPAAVPGARLCSLLGSTQLRCAL